jgi:hypothetical protein
MAKKGFRFTTLNPVSYPVSPIVCFVSLCGGIANDPLALSQTWFAGDYLQPSFLKRFQETL